VLIESAIILATVLTLVLGMLELGLLGFLQITVDAGAFLNAHQNVIGVNDPLGPADATHLVFPQIDPAAITNTVQTAPVANVPVDYGYNSPDAGVQAVSDVNRHGGASIMQPYISQTTITETPLSFLNNVFRVHSQASDANWLESMAEWGVANTNYGTPYTPGNNQLNTNVINNGENTPLYYMSLNFINHCATPGSWGTTDGVCPIQDVLALGMAEYLDINNWSNQTPGVGGPAGSTGPGGTTGTFEAAACHQRMYAKLASFFANVETEAQLHSTDPLNYIEYTYNPYYFNQSGYTDFSSTNASFFGRRPNRGTADAADLEATQAIQTIYSWDVERFQGQGGLGGIGDNPLHPTLGCT
jgi:hypothetical protein